MKSNIQKKQLIQFSYIISFGFPIIIGWIIPAIGGDPFRKWTLIVSIPSMLLGQINPDLLLYPYKLWMKIGYILGWLNSRIILLLVFFLVLQPIALIMKLFGYDPLRLKKGYQKTYKEKKNNKKIDLKRIF